MYAAALHHYLDPNQTQRAAPQTLDSIGNQFDSGEFDRHGPSSVVQHEFGRPGVGASWLGSGTDKAASASAPGKR